MTELDRAHRASQSVQFELAGLLLQKNARHLMSFLTCSVPQWWRKNIFASNARPPMRREFPKPVRREALLRSGGLCEGEGPKYGLADGLRCNLSLSYGVHFDHVNPDGNGGEPTLENCAAVCPDCHAHKTKLDVARIAKMKRQRDRNQGIKRRKGPPMLGSRDSGFRKRMDGTVERR